MVWPCALSSKVCLRDCFGPGKLASPRYHEPLVHEEVDLLLHSHRSSVQGIRTESLSCIQ